MTKAGKVDTGAVPLDPDELGWFIDASILRAVLAAHDDEKFDPAPVRRGPRATFLLVVVAVVLLHALLVALLLLRDSGIAPSVSSTETPVEVVVEPPKLEPVKPPEPPKPPEKQPEPPKPKEDLSPSTSAPRAPQDLQLKTQTKEEKTAAPTKTDTPTKGEAKPTPTPPAAPEEARPDTAPKSEANPDTPKPEANAVKPEDETKPLAEPLDKGAQKKARTAKTKEPKSAKAAPRHKPVPNAIAALAGAPTLDATMSFAKPTPKTKIFGGTDDVRWMSQVEAMLEAKVGTLPTTDHYQSGGKVAICFHVDENGRVIAKEYCAKSGYPDIDRLAMQALLSAAPFPPPPPGLERGLIWVSTFDGRLPKLHFR